MIEQVLFACSFILIACRKLMVEEKRFGGHGKIRNKVMCYINVAS